MRIRDKIGKVAKFKSQKKSFKEEHLGPVRGVRFIKEGPDFWLRVLPSGHLATVVLVLKPKLLCNLLVRRLVRLNVQLVEDGQGGLGVPVGHVRHPTARFHLKMKVQMMMMTAASAALVSRNTILRWDYNFEVGLQF